MIDDLRGVRATSPGPAAHSRKTIEKAVEFEGILLNQILESLQRSIVGSGEESEADPGTSTLGTFASSALSHALAQSGGLGIARMLLAHLPAESDQSVTSLVPSDVNQKPALPIGSVGTKDRQLALK